jgi:hypothetical protein
MLRLWLLLLLLHPAWGDSPIRICDSSNTALPTSPAYTDYIRFLYASGLSTESLITRNDSHQFDNENKIANAILAGYFLPQNADQGGNLARCARITENQNNARKGVALTVNWPSDLPVKYQDYSTPPPLYISQIIPLISTMGVRHDFVAKSLRTTLWTSVYLQSPTQVFFEKKNVLWVSYVI